MPSPSRPQPHTPLQTTGFFLFVFLCGVPALELNGFGMGIPFTLPMALACATLGGAVGGMLICSRPLVAGLTGGLLAGPLGLIAVYYYTRHRVEVSHLELVIVQGIACLPGVGIGLLVKRILSPPSSGTKQLSHAKAQSRRE
jgi:hypothetical protein